LDAHEYGDGGFNGHVDTELYVYADLDFVQYRDVDGDGDLDCYRERDGNRNTNPDREPLRCGFNIEALSESGAEWECAGRLEERLSQECEMGGL
jgi:hypothetical protein